MAPASSRVTLAEAKLHGDETIETPYGDIELEHGYITDEGSQRLFDAMDFQRAAQAYVWSTPLVSFTTWWTEQDRLFGSSKLGTFAVLRSMREKRGIVTGNLTTPYIFMFPSLADGPIVVDYPAGATAGALIDAWQRSTSDLGLTGPDEGRGGRYVLVGPGDDPSAFEAEGDYVFRSPTVRVGIGFRVLDPRPEFEQQVRDTIRMARLGEPLAPCTFSGGVDEEWSATVPRGLDYWGMLQRSIDVEPVREQDKVWMAMLEPLGIKKGEAFEPDERQTRILLEGAAFGELLARNLQVVPRYADPYWPDTGWYKSFDFSMAQSTDYKVELDERITWFYEAVSATKGMITPTVGQGQVYMTTKRDGDGALLRADQTYRLSVPDDVPAAQFWSLTLYSENTRRPYDNGGDTIESINLDSRMEQLIYNDDGSVDLYIGAAAPEGMEPNFMQTTGDDGWFVYFRLYGPTEPFFDKTFSLPDFIRVS
jgi:hypothetical protein